MISYLRDAEKLSLYIQMALTFLVVDDHTLIRKGIASILKKHDPSWEVFEAENGIQAIFKASEIRPDIILMDYLMPKLDGVQAAIAIRRELPDSKIIMVSMDLSEDVVIRTIHAGVAGFVPKDSSDQELLSAITAVHKGNLHIPVNVFEMASGVLVKSRVKRSDSGLIDHMLFTARETEILKLLTQGYSSGRIAAHLSISRRTVESHRANIFKKCKVHSISSLIRWAIKNNIITL